jgi:hypothetical protein
MPQHYDDSMCHIREKNHHRYVDVYKHIPCSTECFSFAPKRRSMKCCKSNSDKARNRLAQHEATSKYYNIAFSACPAVCISPVEESSKRTRDAKGGHKVYTWEAVSGWHHATSELYNNHTNSKRYPAGNQLLPPLSCISHFHNCGQHGENRGCQGKRPNPFRESPAQY